MSHWQNKGKTQTEMKNTKETWKPVVGYEGLYEVSDLGRVKKVARTITQADGTVKKIDERILKQSDSNGYQIVGLYRNGVSKSNWVHRLVALAFIPNNDQSKTVINHKDENKRNNSVANLEWCTYKYNANYGTRNERVGKSNSKPIQQLDLKTGLIIATYPSLTEASLSIGIHWSTISNVAKGRGKTAGGYGWRYQN